MTAGMCALKHHGGTHARTHDGPMIVAHQVKGSSPTGPALQLDGGSLPARSRRVWEGNTGGRHVQSSSEQETQHASHISGHTMAATLHTKQISTH